MNSKQAQKNITLTYLIIAFKNCLLWVGIWIFYYSRFGGYRAVGILEATMAITTILAEIPTGAIGDLIGKKKTIIIVFIIETITQIWMGLAPNLTHMILSLIVMNIGGALFSGTYEAIIYDTLKESNQTHSYKRVLGNTKIIVLVIWSICGIASGFLYKISPGLPFILTGFVQILGLITALFLTEPKVDTEKFTLKTFFIQNVQGFKQLFRKNETRKTVIGILLIGIITMIVYEGYNDIIAMEVGFNPQQLGIMTTIVSIFGAISMYFLVRWTEKYSNRTVLTICASIFALTLLIAPISGIVLGGFGLIIRYILDPLINNEFSDTINKEIESKHRATSISTFNMIRYIPYAILILLLGYISDIISPLWVSAILGGILIVFTGINMALQSEKRNNL